MRSATHWPPRIRAANLVELAWPALRMNRHEATMLSWVKALPDKLIRVRPVLSVAYALALLADSEMEAGDARLRDAEHWLDTAANPRTRPEAPAPEMVVADKEKLRSLPASIANARAYRAQALGDVPLSTLCFGFTLSRWTVFRRRKPSQETVDPVASSE